MNGYFEREIYFSLTKFSNNFILIGNRRIIKSDFDYAGRMIETLMLGLAAHKAGMVLNYDPSAGRVTNYSASNENIKKEYRKGWVLNG
jgi:hypothetical protein